MSTAPSPFDPVTIGPLRLRNRFIKSGANEAMCLDGAPTRALVKHHRDLAAGGVGLTTVAYVAVSEVGRTLPNQIWMRPGSCRTCACSPMRCTPKAARSRRRSPTAAASSPA